MSGAPLFSLVVPCYRVAKYLPDFFSALDAQLSTFSDFEVVFVVDGCPEDSEILISAWQETSNCASKLIVTKNHGVSSARNTGMKAATGKWVSFPDPDDLIAPDYLGEVARQLDRVTGIDAVVTRIIKTTGDSSRRLRHPLDYRFREGTRIVDMAAESDFFHLYVTTGFYERQRLATLGLEFDSSIRVSEDAKFVAEFLLSLPTQRILVCSEAFYYYRVRDDGSGALASSESDLAGRYIDNIPRVYLAMLDAAGPRAPLWLQNSILYDLYWLFAASMQPKGPIHGANQHDLQRLNELLQVLLARIDYEGIRAFHVVEVPPEIRSAWLVANAGVIRHRWVRAYRHDANHAAHEYRYLSSRMYDSDLISVDGAYVEPLFAKWRSVRFFGRVWLYEHIVWAPAGRETVFLADETSGEGFANHGVPLSDREFRELFAWQAPKRPDPRERIPLGNGTYSGGRTSVFAPIRQAIRKMRRGLISKFAVLPVVSWPYRNAWLLMDRDTQANDNAEALYRYLHREHPEVNAYFVLRKSSPDYARLKREGFRMLPFAGVRNYLALRNASHLISSHIDEFVVRPFKKLQLRKTWNFVFLQHGVTQNDLSRWLNPKDLDLIIATTSAEAEEFTRDGSPYTFSRREVALTGMPRHDALVRAMNSGQMPLERSILLIMPTWRNHLVVDSIEPGSAKSPVEDFSGTEFVRSWSSVFNDPRILSLCESHGLEIVLLPHPLLEPHLGFFEVPSYVRVASYLKGSIAELLASARISLTDYSSQAFESAFCLTPSIYFQFDRDEFFGGNQMVGAGYFDVDVDGFGPVVKDIDGVVRALGQLLSDNEPDNKIYFERMSALYPARDGKSSERVFGEVSKLKNRR